MESRESELGLLVVVAVAAFAYYYSTAKLAPQHKKRRLTVLRRLEGGTSPLELLKEGFSPAELLDAGVPPQALQTVPLMTPSISPSKTTRRVCRDRSPSTSGVFHWVYDAMMRTKCTMQVVSEARRDSQRSGGISASVSGVTLGSVDCSTASRWAQPNWLSAESPSNSSLRSSARLATHAEPSPLQRSVCQCSSLERSSSIRTTAGATRVRVEALSAALTHGYTGECAAHHYPLQVLRFLHEDGSRLSIMAENCTTLKGAADLTTEMYMKSSLARARAAAEDAETPFQVKLSTAARNIATTVMEWYVNTYVGSPPVVLAGFYLVKGSVAYTIQLQTNTDAYEERLPDLLYTAQSARLLNAEGAAAQLCPGGQGRKEYHVQAEGFDRVYVVEAPVEISVRALRAPNGARSELILTPWSSGGEIEAPWKATVAVRLNAGREHAQGGERQHYVLQLLSDARVSIELTVHMAGNAAAGSRSPPPVPASLAAIAAREATTEDELSSSVYRSAGLTMPLPPPEHFHTVVCEHPAGQSLTLFITPATSAELFEMELHCMNGMNNDSLEELFSYTERLLLTPIRPKLSTNAAGQACFSIEGLAVSPTGTALQVFGVQLREECWVIVRWLCASRAVIPRELEQYRLELAMSVVCSAH
ncbi:hypothetical protein LSCM1_00692 [Leishmania martiniquensis]|uniref:Uncharacterized protein n=1 Tax=Leishmania martiniquensis TaxID=1580590 RepID=A0A836FKX6_9TRYP|nr:hypothetical protein LSCM1_00692 [Leishmania martiniquensis]